MCNKIKNNKVLKLLVVMLMLMALLTGCSKTVNDAGAKLESAYNEAVDNMVEDETEEDNNAEEKNNNETQSPESTKKASNDVKATQKATKESKNTGIPKYNGKAYTVLNNNKPSFTSSDLKNKSYEHYGKLDSLGRCSVAIACIGKNLMPREKRGSIGKVKPTGWHTVKYDIVDGKYLYNRCHLIGYQLTGENANERNLITGTRYLNVDGMLPFEDMVADYVKETGNHVLYRVTPVYKGKNLVAHGVKMEAKSVEDKGKGICFNVFVHNIQPGITIDYATGDSQLSNNDGTNSQTSQQESSDNTEKNTQDSSNTKVEIRGNSKSKIYHCPGQAAYDEMGDSPNLVIFHSEQDAIDAGYRKAKR